MAPRRNNSGHTAVDVHNLLGLDPDALDDNHNQHASSNNNHSDQLSPNNITRCCVPTGDCFKNVIDFGLINMENISDCIRVLCNNENCTAGQYMHRECFENWEQGVLTYLKSIGRARSWSDKQRMQNLWTKKGYDLVFKACGCKCGRGHIKKDLDWVPPPCNSLFGRTDDEANKKKKKRSRTNQKPMLALNGINPSVYHPNSQVTHCGVIGNSMVPQHAVHQYGGNCGAQELRARTGSLSSSNGSSSPPASASSEHSDSPVHNSLVKKQKSKTEIYSDRVRTTSGCNGIFSRRLDFSTFNVLPKTRLNSYQIKMEDEGNHGNDETRLFILSSLAQHQKSRVNCVLCEDAMFVFDRYPLVDGSFFLSPKQHSKGCIEVKYEGRSQFLTAVCMSCLEAVTPERTIRCRFCAEKWDGSALVLGTMYSYDIFAATPCCIDRLQCNNCFKMLVHPQQRLNFYSDYSHVVSCPYCNTQDTHFVKPLAYCYTKQPLQMFQQWP